MEFDAIIVGTGMGGGALGHALARAGMKILFLERGLPKEKFDQAFEGNYPESFLNQSRLPREEIYRRTGRATYKVNGWTPVLGSGAGGGTAVYGSVLLRFHNDDWKTWPAGYSEASINPYYAQCEEMLETRLSGGPLSPWAEDMFAFFKSKGLAPFRTPVGYRKKTDCSQCFGFFCLKDCKKTSFNSFIEPLLALQQAQVAYSTKVKTLKTINRRVIGVVCETDRGEVEFVAPWIFLAAGALATPTLLLNSKNNIFPTGLGNTHDLVGRFLMRHLVDFYYLKTQRAPPADGHLVEVSMADFCHQEGRNWGVINCVPGLMSPEIIASEFAEHLSSQHPRLFPPFLTKRFLKPVVHAFLRQLTRSRVLATPILEDSPDFNNRVLPESTVDDITINYNITPKDHVRLKESRAFLKKFFKPLDGRFLKVAEDSSFLAHVCGTCRMDDDPQKGVVSSAGQVHGVENLFVADASIFPSSSGVNPSLTVAACAMKIGDAFVKNQWKK